MDSRLLWFSVLTAGLALAGPAPRGSQAQVETLVHDNILAISLDQRDSAKLGTTPTTVVFLTSGTRAVVDDTDRLVDNFYGDWQLSVKHAPGKPIVIVDDAKGLAWFQSPYRATVSGQDPDGKEVKPWTMDQRIGGLAVRDKGSWTFAALGYTSLVSDHDLVTQKHKFHDSDPVKGPPQLTGDAGLTKAVAGWFATGFAAHAAQGLTVLASGSSPAEFASGAATAKLVAGWDKLGLQPVSIEAVPVADGKLALVHAEVRMPIKKTDRTAPLVLYVLAIPDGKDWRWLSLQYGGFDYDVD
jgi:hypothetical protein